MCLKFSLIVFFFIFLTFTQSIPLNEELYNEFQHLTEEQLAELDEFLSRKIHDESLMSSSSEILHRMTRRPHQERSIVKRDTLWTTTEVLDCVRRLKLYKDNSKLDFVTEMLNCYRRLKHSG